MQVGVFLKLIDHAGRRTKSVAEVVAHAERAEALGFDSVWVMDHLFTDALGRRVAAVDPLQVLAAIAARTRRVQLGPLVLCGPFRQALQTAREAMTLNDASGGRFICGLGAGWNQPEFDATGVPFDHLVGRLEEQVAEYRRLLAEPGVMPPGPRPWLWIAAFGPRMLRLAARHADGWNAAWQGDDVTRWCGLADSLRAAMRELGRDEAEMTFSAGVLTVVAEGAEAERYRQERPGADFVCGTAAEVAMALKRYEAAGCDHIVLALSQGPGLDHDQEQLDRFGEVLALVK